uniref:Uncharacterized protein n=1 Tax=Triticum urartu TaxID=4572 RepID=A0A8R7UXM3_TRIUA
MTALPPHCPPAPPTFPRHIGSPPPRPHPHREIPAPPRG